MDRALDFFIKGNLSTVSYENGRRFRQSEFNQTINLITLDENNNQVSNTLSNDRLVLNDSFFTPGTYINYRGISGTNQTEPISNDNTQYDSRITAIIDWISNKGYRALTLEPWMFAYLKDINVYPSNRLQILRRFNSGVGHDLFSHKSFPIATLISYMKADKAPSVSINFSENWKTSDDGFLSVLSEVISGISIFGSGSNAPSMDTTSTLGEAFIGYLANSTGITDLKMSPRGNPNMIHEAAIREADYKGLNFDFNYDFETTFIQKDIQAFGVDPEIAMLELIEQCIKMGTSKSEFVISGNGSDIVNSVIKNLTDGNSSNDNEALNEIINAATTVITNVTDKIGNFLKTTADKASTEGLTEAAKFVGGKTLDTLKEFGSFYISAYYWKLYGAAASMTGLHTAPWHLTLGNPKSPYFSIGNLICSNVQLEMNNEFGYSDVPTELKVKCTLKNGRRLGAQEISSLFNSGKGRIYYNPDNEKRLYKK